MATQAALNTGLYPAMQSAVAQPANAKLNPYVQLMPDSSHETWATVWYVASIVTLVAYVALAALAIFLTGIYEPIFLPVVTLVSMLLIDQAWDVSQYFEGKSLEESDLANFEARMARKLKELPTAAPELANYLVPFQNGLNLPNIENLVESRPLLARYFCWREKIVDLEQKAEALIKTGEAHPECLTDLRIQALKLHECAGAAKIYAAYIRGVLLNPYLPYDWSDLIDFPLQKMPLENRLRDEGLSMRYDSGQRYAEIFVTFKKNTTTTHLTTDQVRAITDVDICKIMFGGCS